MIPEKLIDTDTIPIAKETIDQRLERNKEIKNYWNKRALEDSLKGVSVKYLTEKYIDYLGLKLISLFFKYAFKHPQPKNKELDFFPGIPRRKTLKSIFHKFPMSELISKYYEIVTFNLEAKKFWIDTKDIEGNITALFKMLEKEFETKNEGPIFIIGLRKEYP